MAKVLLKWVALVLVLTWAASADAGELAVQAPWARATARMATTGAVYFTLVNNSASPDRLVSAASPAAETVELHTHFEEDGVLRMRPIDGIDIPADGKVAFQPGGLHVMLVGLRGALKEGHTVPVTLVFEKAGPVTAMARILPIGARVPQ